MIRPWSAHDPTMIRPHTRPSRTRRTAEVDHRGSGTDFVWKNIGFRASAISQKRISCETSSKTPSATPPPAPLAIPFTVRERSLELQITMEFCRPHMHQTHLQPHLQCGNDATVANHNGILSTTHARNTGETPFTMRNRSEHDPRISDHDPTTHETVSHPSHRRGRSSRFGDGLCMEKHRLFRARLPPKLHRQLLHQHHLSVREKRISCETSFLLTKLHRQLLHQHHLQSHLQWGGTILELQITMEFHRQLIHQHHLQPHLQCGNDPTVANHNGILSTTHARNTGETPFTMRNRSEHDPRSAHIRPWSDHTRDRLAPVAPQR